MRRGEDGKCWSCLRVFWAGLVYFCGRGPASSFSERLGGALRWEIAQRLLREAIARAETDPPIVVAGDAVADLVGQVRAVAPHAYPVVVCTWMLTYLDATAQRNLLAELDRVGAERDLSLVFAEQPARVEGFELPPRPDGQEDGLATAVAQLRWVEGRRSGTRLADAHPHGRWIEWLQR